MEFICSKEEIQKNLSYAEGVVASRTTLAILSNVLIETDENSIEISSTDLEVGFKTKIPAEIKMAGSITLQAKKLSEIIKSFVNCNLTFVLEKQNRVSIFSEEPKIKAKFKMVGIPKDDYPKIPAFEEEKVLPLNQALLKEMIKKTIISVSTEEARYFLNGVYFEKKGNRLHLVATDGKRLSYMKLDLKEIGDIEDFNVIVPSKVLNELVKILGDEGVCQTSFTENKVFFQFNSTMLVSNLLEGQFPNYKQVIPDDVNNILTLTTSSITDAIKRVSHMVDPKLAQIRLEVVNNQLTLYANHPDFGEAKDEIESEYKGEDINAAFNYHFLLDALREVDNKEVFFKMTDSKRPMIIEGTGDENYFSVIMPMKLTEE